MKVKEPTNNHVAILEEALFSRCGPLRTSQSLNYLQDPPESQLPATEAHNQGEDP